MIDPRQYPEQVRDAVGQLSLIVAQTEMHGEQLKKTAERIADQADVIAARNVAQLVGVAGALSAVNPSDPTQ